MIVYCGACGKFFNGAKLEKCPHCGSEKRTPRVSYIERLPTCKGADR